MKKLKLFILTLGVLLLAASCEKEGRTKLAKLESIIDNPETLIVSMSNDVEEIPGTEAEWCGIQTFDLIGGQHYLMGSVTVLTNTSNGKFYVKYQPNSGCVIKETHVFVGDDYPNTGNPAFGQFPVKWESDGEKIPGKAIIHEIELDVEPGTCIDIIAHAEVICGDRQETAFAKPRDVVFALKSLINESTEYTMTGTEDCGDSRNDWCYKMGFETLDLLLPFQSFPLLNLDGCLNGTYVEITKNGDEYSFEITYGNGTKIEPDKFYLYVGSEVGFHSYDLCAYEYQDFPTETVVTIPSVSYQEFAGSRWGWFIDEYCLCIE